MGSEEWVEWVGKRVGGQVCGVGAVSGVGGRNGSTYGLRNMSKIDKGPKHGSFKRPGLKNGCEGC